MRRLWRDMDDDDKARLVKTTGLIVAAFTLFTLLATLSYSHGRWIRAPWPLLSLTNL